MQIFLHFFVRKMFLEDVWWPYRLFQVDIHRFDWRLEALFHRSLYPMGIVAFSEELCSLGAERIYVSDKHPLHFAV